MYFLGFFALYKFPPPTSSLPLVRTFQRDISCFGLSLLSLNSPSRSFNISYAASALPISFALRETKDSISLLAKVISWDLRSMMRTPLGRRLRVFLKVSFTYYSFGIKYGIGWIKNKRIALSTYHFRLKLDPLYVGVIYFPAHLLEPKKHEYVHKIINREVTYNAHWSLKDGGAVPYAMTFLRMK